MARLEDHQNIKLDAHIIYLRRKILKAERTLARETKKRAMPCRCQGGGYEFSQDDFEKVRKIYESARVCWLAEHSSKT